MNKFSIDDVVEMQTGSNKGKRGYVVCYTIPHPLASHKLRLQVRCQTGKGWRTLLVNEENLKLVY